MDRWLQGFIADARRGRLGVLTDVDGTISPLAPRPELARVDPRARDALGALVPAVALVGVISGRELDDLRTMVGLPDLYYSGGHGISSWYRGEELHAAGAEHYARYVDAVCTELGARLAGWPVRFERKRFGLAVHYRDAPDPDAARTAVLGAVTVCAAAWHFDVREGARVVELLPRLGITKGAALHHVVDRFRLGAIVYFGDDVTDADAFRALRELRGSGRITGVAVAAMHGETAGEAALSADVSVPGVDGVVSVLEELVRGL